MLHGESSVKDHLLGPPLYSETVNCQQPITTLYRTATNPDDIISSAPVAISTGLIQPQPSQHPCQGIIITAIIVGGIVALALIASGTYIFVNHRAATTTTSTTTTTTKRPICFDGDGFVVKEDGSQVKIRDIKIGDQILVFETAMKTITLRPSPVLAIDIFQKYNNESPVKFLEIQTKSKFHVKPLHITPRHSLLVKKEHGVQIKYLFASEIQVGDYLYIIGGKDRSAVQSRVTSIRSVQLFDAYAPLTLEGTLVVNNAVVSCYGTYNHVLVHWIMAPRRWLRYLSLRMALSLIAPDFSEKYIDYLHNYFTTIDLCRFFILNSIRDLISTFE